MSEAYHTNPYNFSSSAGRWNPGGTRMIYASSSPSLALLEYLCIKGSAVASRMWYMIVFEIIDDALIGTLEKTSLPDDWNVLPHGKSTQDFGRMWLEDKAFPFLKVPSARMDITFYPGECNLLINPDFAGLERLLTVAGEIPVSYLLNP